MFKWEGESLKETSQFAYGFIHRSRLLFWIISNTSWFNPSGQLSPTAAWSSSSSWMGERITRVKVSKLVGGSKNSLIGKAKGAFQAK